MRTLVLDDDWGKWKFGDTDAVMTFTPKTDDNTLSYDNNVLTFKIAQADGLNSGDYIASAPGHVASNSQDVELDTSDLAQLEPGTYAVELWITNSITRKTQVYPSDSYCFFTIDQNTMGVTDISNISNKTLQAVYADLLQKVNAFKQGVAGEDGVTPKLVAGTVTKLPSDAQPTFLLTPLSTDPNTYRIDLGLPAGPKGDKGDSIKGDKGDPGDDGVTPHIDKATGDWFVGSLDTMVKAQGPAGEVPDMSQFVKVDALNDQLTVINAAIKSRVTSDQLQAVADANGQTLSKLNSLINSLSSASVSTSQSNSTSSSSSTSQSMSSSSSASTSTSASASQSMSSSISSSPSASQSISASASTSSSMSSSLSASASQSASASAPTSTSQANR
ncbi:hypothetical protein KSL82_06210 [Limosilactobacillus portuensis]|uniref:Uncharacterized protein n=1 Tax=Limosilactobacillus portuensis TaxID=2742601 RepID=A0ABS6IVE2_9LACO|nr:hypothetical protein [Limosilactobacillus portuensis]MBU9695488.1 hypothetical protein [Limosilactobacillus portuensis]